MQNYVKILLKSDKILLGRLVIGKVAGHEVRLDRAVDEAEVPRRDRRGRPADEDGDLPCFEC